MQMVIEVSVVGSDKFGRLLWTCTIWNMRKYEYVLTFNTSMGRTQTPPSNGNMTWTFHSYLATNWLDLGSLAFVRTWRCWVLKDWYSTIEQIIFSKSSLHHCYAQERGQGWLRRTLVSLSVQQGGRGHATGGCPARGRPLHDQQGKK